MLAGPKEGYDKSFDFSVMKSSGEWDKEDAQHSLTITLLYSMCDEKAALVRHIETRLEFHLVAKELGLKILDASMDWWEAFFSDASGFYNKIVA